MIRYKCRRWDYLTIFLRLLKKVSKMDFSVILLFSIFIIVIGTFGIHYFEPNTFPTVFESFWWTMTTLTTVGYGDYSPITVPGRLLGIFLFIFGIGIIGLLISNVVDSLTTYNQLKREGKVVFKGKNHIIYIGWSQKTERAIQEVFAHLPEMTVVLIDSLKENPFNHDQIHYIQGDASDEEVLLKANILEAKRVAIFADEAITQSILADGKTLLIASAVESLSHQHNKDIHTIVEICEDKNIPKFHHIHVDDFILSNDSISMLMAKSTLHPGTTSIFRQLLSKRFGNNIHELLPKAEWKTYKEASENLLAYGAVLIAVNDEMDFTNAHQKPLKSDDLLYIVCHDHVYEKIKS
nr:potassium channel family protein [Bacillus pakistanensis]